MTNRRRPAWQITPLIEDSGLFKREVRDVAVDLVPVFSRNNRKDLVVAGIVAPGTEIEVVFAGRRSRDAVSLIDRMKQLRTHGLRHADTGHQAMAALRKLRLEVQIRGTWRLRFARDDSGWEAKKYQLIAAQWAFHDLDGYRVLAGSPPAEPETTRRMHDRARAERARLAAARSRVAETQGRD